MLFVKPPFLLTRALTNVTWDFYGSHNRIYLTFDDGPTPEVTPWVLETLAEYGAAATFFCLGRNVDKHPGIYRQILEAGHSVGNHSYSHLKGFRTSIRTYRDDIELASNLIDSKLFRPPYGRIFPGQVRALMNNYRIIMWDVLSNDYDKKIPGERIVRNVISNVKPGSIIVFHDSDKASKNLYYALPRVLQHLRSKNYDMVRIPDNGFMEGHEVN